MITLAHLRKVVLQDAAALMLIVEGQCMYSQHHIFTKISAFSTPEFHEFILQLQQSMSVAKSPLTDSLAANTPTIQQEFRSMKTSMASMDAFLRDNLGYLRNRADAAEVVSSFETLTVAKQVQALDQRMMSIMHGLYNTIGNSMAEMSRSRAVTNMEVQQRQQLSLQLRQEVYRRGEQSNANERRRLLLRPLSPHSQQPEQDLGDLLPELPEEPAWPPTESSPGEPTASMLTEDAVPALQSCTMPTLLLTAPSREKK